MNRKIIFLVSLAFSSSLSDWDFSGLEVSSFNETTNGSYIYRYNFRKAVPVQTPCSTSGCVLFEQYALSGSCPCYGAVNTENVMIEPDDSRINFTYSYNGNYAHFILKCSQTNLRYAYYTDSFNDFVEIYAPQGCKKASKGKKKSKLGWGFAFFLILVILIFLYFAVGIPVSYHIFHKRGIEMLPFIVYIGSFFALVGYGAKFLFVTIVGAIRGRGGYSGGGDGKSYGTYTML